LRGLENNFGLKIDRSALLTSQDRVEVTLGEFVTRFVSQARFSRSERRQNRLEFNQSGQVADIFDEDVLQLRVGLEQQFTTGARASISNVSSRTVNPTTRRGLELSQVGGGITIQGPAYNPEFQSITVLNVTQPLLQGRGARSTLAENRLARIGVDELAEANRELAEFRISQARLRQAEARLELIDHRLARSDIRAPFASVVVQGDLRERIGAPVQQGEVLVQLSELEGLYLQIRVPERDIDLVGDNRTGAVVFASRPDLQFPFEIRSISPAARIADEGNIFAVRAALVETAEWMTPGMTGVAKIDSGKRTLAWRATHRIVDFIRMRIWF
jgi:hypothetical protein